MSPQYPAGSSTRSARRRSSGFSLRHLVLAVAALALLASPRLAAQPTGGTLISGTGSIVAAPGTTTVTAGNNSVFRWGSFNLGATDTVQFIQPSAEARVLNWIGGLTPSQINGTLLANGQVYLLNPAGVYFGSTAVVDVGRLYAVGGSLSKEDFLAGLDRFTNLTGAVRNEGTLRGNAIALVGRSVLNSGTIISADGFVALGAGDQVLLGRSGSSIYVDTGHSAPANAADAAGTGIANSGSINAGRGSVVLAAGDLYSVAITHDGQLTARDVRLQGQGRGDVLVSGSINASATQAGETGGRVEITGDRVGLLTGARVNASGPAGGGTILVGGDAHGTNAAVRNASYTSVLDGVSLRADATAAGNGGKVVVWSNEATRFAGDISARGGLAGGNGGFVETSGHDYLLAVGSVDASAPRGSAGNWLLDPRNVTIDTTTSGGAFAAGVFTPTADDATVNRDTIQTSLNGGTTVTINTGSDGTQAGNITVNATITKSSGGDAALFLTAANNITINQDITNTSTAGILDLTLTANDDATGGGSVFVNSQLDTRGGAFASSGVDFLLANTGSILTRGGSIDLTHTGAISIGAQLSSGVTAATPGASATGGAITLTTTGGSITVTPSGSIDSSATGAAGGAGNPGGNATAGGITLTGTSLAIQAGSTIFAKATGGQGGAGASGNPGDPGGAGGTATGGNISLTATTGLAAVAAAVSTNAQGGDGGAGGDGSSNNRDGGVGGAGGTGTAGTIAITGNAVNLTAPTVTARGLGGQGGLGGSGGGGPNSNGAHGGDGGSGVANTVAVTFNTGGSISSAIDATATAGAVGADGTPTGGGIVSGTVPNPGTATAANVTLDNAGAVTTTGASVAGAALVLQGSGTIGTSGTRLATTTPAVVFNKSGGTAFVGTGAVSLSGTGTGTASLNVSATGAITQSGALTVPGTASFTTGAAAITLGNPGNSFVGAVDVHNTGANDITLVNGGALVVGTSSVGGNLSLTFGGPLSQTGGLTVAGTTTLIASAAATDLDLGTQANDFAGAIIFGGTVTNIRDLALRNGNAGAVFPTLTGLTNLRNFTLNFTAATIVLPTTVTTAGSQTYLSPVVLSGDTTLDTSGSNSVVTFGGTVNSSTGNTDDLTLLTGNAAVLFGGAVGGGVGGGLGTLTITNAAAGGLALPAVTAQNVALTFSGPLTQTGALTVSGTTTLTAGAAATDINLGTQANNLASSITFGGTLTNIRDFSLRNGNAGAVFPTLVGLTNLRNFTLNYTGVAITLPTTVTTLGTQSYLSPVVLSGNTTLNTSATNSVVTFSSTVNSSTGNHDNLTLLTGNAAPVFGGALGGGVGGELGTLTITNTAAAGLALPAVTAQNVALTFGGPLTQTGALTVSGTTTLTATAAATDINLGTQANSLASSITFGGTLTNIRDFSLRNGNAGAVFPTLTGLTNLRNFTLNYTGVAITLPTAVTTLGTQSYLSPVVLSGGTILDTSATNSVVTFSSTVDSSTGNHDNLTLLTGNAAPVFGGALGGGVGGELGTLTITNTAAAGLALPAVTAQNVVLTFGGPLTQTGALTVSGITTLTATAAATDINLGTQANNLASSIIFGGSLANIRDFSLRNGNAGAVFPTLLGLTNLRDLTLNFTGATITLPTTVTTLGTQRYLTAVQLAGNTTLSGTALVLGGTVAGAGFNLDLAFTSGSSVDGAVITGVNNLSATSGTVALLGAITTFGTQTYTGAISLGSATTLTSSGGGALNLAGTVTGGGLNLTLNTLGTTTLGGAVAGVNALQTNAGGTTVVSGTVNAASVSFGDAVNLNGGSVTTSAGQSYAGAVLLGADTTLTGTGVVFGSTVGGSGLARSLTLAGATNGTFGGAVGTGGNLISTLAVGGTAAINGGAVTTTGLQNYTGAVTLGADTTLTGTSATFGSTVGGGGVARALTLAGTTNATFGGAAGGVGNLLSSVSVGGTSALNGSTVTTTGAQVFSGAVTLGANTTLTSTASGALTLANGVTGAGRDLTLNTAGVTTLAGTVSGIGALQTDAPGSTTVSGPLSAASVTLNDPAALNGSAVLTTGAQTYGGAVTLGADTTLTGTSVTFGSTVGGGGVARALTLAGATNGTFGGAAGGAGNLLSTLSVGGTSAINGGAVTTTGAQTYTGAVTLGADTTLASTGSGALTLSNGVTGAAHNLTLNTAGVTTLTGAVSGVNALLTDATGSTVVNGTINAGTVTLNDPATLSGGTVTTTGGQTYAGAVTLGANTTLVSTGGGNLTLAGITGAGRNLTLNTAGVTTLGGTVSGLNDLLTDLAGSTVVSGTVSAVTVTLNDPAALNGGLVTTTGAQAYNGAVTLGADTTLTGTGVTFGSTVGGGGVARSLTLSGATNGTFGGAVGGVGNLLSTLTVGGTSAINGGAVTTTGAQTYTGAVTLGANTTLTGTTVTFGSTVGGGGTARTLALGGTTNGIFGGAAGGAGNLLSSLSVGGTAALNGGAVTTTGAQTYGSTATLGVDTTLTGTSVTFASTVGGGGVARALTLAGATNGTFGGAAGGAGNLLSTLSVGGTSAINGGAVTTTGAQTYTGAVTMGADTTLASTGSGALTLSNGVTGAAHNLTLNTAGVTTLGAVSGVNALLTDAPGSTVVNGTVNAGTVTLNDPATLSGGTVTTTGGQTYAGAVTLGANTTLVSTGGGNLTLAGITGAGRNLTLNTAGVTTLGGTVSGLNDLLTDLAGSTVVSGTVSAVTVTLNDPAALNGGLVTTTGAQAYNGAVTLGADTTLTGTGVTFGSTVGGGGVARALTLSGATNGTFGGAVGGVGNLLSTLTVGGTSAINGGTVTTTGAQLYTGMMTLGADTTLASTGGGALTLSNGVTGAGHNFTLNTSGLTTLGGTATGVNALVTDAGGSTVIAGAFSAGTVTLNDPAALNGGAVTTTGTQTYAGAVTLGADTTLTGTSVTFGSTVGGGAIARALALAGSTNGTFGGAAGGAGNLLSTLTVGGTSAINGGAVTTNGTQTYTGAVTLGADTTLASTGGGALTLSNGVTGAAHNLTLNTAGVTTLGAVSGVNALLTDAPGSTVVNGALSAGTVTLNDPATLNGGSVTTTGAQYYGGAVTLGSGAVLTATNSPVQFVGTVNSAAGGNHNLSILTGSAAPVFGGGLGTLAGGGLGALTVTNSSGTGLALPAVTAQSLNITTAGPISDYGDLAIAGLATLNSGAGSIVLGDTTTANFGSLVLTGGSINIREGSDLHLVSATANDLTLTSISGVVAVDAANVTQGLAVTAAGSANLQNAIVGTGLTVTSGGAANFGGVSAGSLTVTSGGNVTDDGSLTVGGAATINAGGNAITLGDSSAANFGSLALTGGTVSVKEVSDLHVTSATASDLTLQSTSGGIDLDAATVTNGLVRLTAAGSVNAGVGGSSTVVTAGSLLVDAGGSADVRNANLVTLLSILSGGGTNIGNVNVAPGDLLIHAGGDVTNLGGPVTVGGGANIVSGTNNIFLNNLNNNFNTVTISGNTVIINDLDTLTLLTIATGGSFSATAGGQLTVALATTLQGHANISLTSTGADVTINSSIATDGGNITVQAARNIFQNASLLDTSPTGTISFQAGGNATLGQFATAGGAVTVTAGGSVEFAGALTGQFAVHGPINVTAGTAGVKFDQAVDGSGATADLTVNTTGATQFLGAVGGGSALHSLVTNAGGTTTVAGGRVITSGAQTYGDALILGANTLLSGNVTFNNSVSGPFDLTVSGPTVFNFAGTTATPNVQTSGVQTYNGTVNLQQATVLTATGSGSVVFNNAVTGTSLTVNGPTAFGFAGTLASPTVQTTGAQTYNGAVSLLQDTVLSSTLASADPATPSILLLQAVTGAGRALTLSAAQGVVAVASDIGDVSGRLSAVTANGRDLIIGGDIWTSGNIALANGTGTTGSTNDYIQFNYGAPGAARNTRLDSATGEIVLGSGATGGTAKTAAPLRSSIYKSNDGDVYLFARKVTVQPFERMAVRNGSLIVLADGTDSDALHGITLGNTAVSNYLVLATSTSSTVGINLRSRGPADIELVQGTGVIKDLGTDLIAGAVLFFNKKFSDGASTNFPTRDLTNPAGGHFAPTPVTASAANFFDYKTFTGNILQAAGSTTIAILPDEAGVRHNVFVADLLTTNNFRPLVPNLVYLDLSTASGFAQFRDKFIDAPTFGITGVIPQRTLVATGAQVRNTLEQAFTPDVPRSGIETPLSGADIAAAVREQLQALGIYARALLPAERATRERRAGQFVVVPNREHPRESDYEVADARVEDRAVRDVIRLASEAGLIGAGQAKLEEVARSLALTFDAFAASATAADGRAFRAWLEARQDADAVRVKAFADSLQATLKKIEQLGLTRMELDGSKAQIYGSILKPLRADPEFLREFVESAPASKPTLSLAQPPRLPAPSVVAVNPISPLTLQ